MDFFERYKIKTAIINVMTAIFLFLLAAFPAAGAIFLREAMGTAFSILCLVLFCFLAVCAILAVIQATKNPGYDQLISTVQKIGSPESVGASLSMIAKCKYAKGDLRFDGRYFFYHAGNNFCLLQTSKISNIRPFCEESRYKYYYVIVSTDEESIHIPTTKNYTLPLIKSIQQAVEKAQNTGYYI